MLPGRMQGTSALAVIPMSPFALWIQASTMGEPQRGLAAVFPAMDATPSPCDAQHRTKVPHNFHPRFAQTPGPCIKLCQGLQLHHQNHRPYGRPESWWATDYPWLLLNALFPCHCDPDSTQLLGQLMPLGEHAVLAGKSAGRLGSVV
jgi:hypothetical protein